MPALSRSTNVDQARDHQAETTIVINKDPNMNTVTTAVAITLATVRGVTVAADRPGEALTGTHTTSRAETENKVREGNIKASFNRIIIRKSHISPGSHSGHLGGKTPTATVAVEATVHGAPRAHHPTRGQSGCSRASAVALARAVRVKIQ